MCDKYNLKYNLLHPTLHGDLSETFSGQLADGDLALLLLETFRHRRGGTGDSGQSDPTGVINELSINVPGASENDKPRFFGGSG